MAEKSKLAGSKLQYLYGSPHPDSPFLCCGSRAVATPRQQMFPGLQPSTITIAAVKGLFWGVLSFRYEEFRESLHHCKLPGGTEREHGGTVLPVLPKDHRSPCTLVRGHLHFGSDVFPWPRGLPIEQYYDVTLLKKSDVRMNDDLPLSLPFPTSHPYQTHISRYAMFPDFRSPEDRDTGTDASSCQPFHSNIPCKAFDMVVLRKTRGNPYRHEVVGTPFDSLKEALCCSRQHACLQLPKFSEEKDQIYYPNPSKIVAPNSTFRELEHKVSSRTSNILQNLERAQWITTYNRNFTGKHFKETFVSSLSQVRPLGGRTVRLLQGRRPRESVLQGQHCCHEQAKPPQVSQQKDHYLDAGLPISTFQKIIDRKQAEALSQGQFSGRPELQSLPESAHSLSWEDLKTKHLDQHTIWANPLSEAVLPQDGNREESKIVLHKLWNQEASEPAWRPEDRLREVALPEWIPGSEVARRQTVLLELQDSFSKTAAQKRFHDSINGETKDLRDNINEGRRHEFYGFNAFYFHN
uniref:Chromosome 7 open reading frame 31 n=1 Tax=Phasianus colchicus TaxID=9054 RepID=A0A669PCH7_PHACC